MTPPRSERSQVAAVDDAADAAEPAADPAADPVEGIAGDELDEFAELSYEQARDALVDVVRRLEGGAETLEESLALWERGEALARHCERWLAGARARLDAAGSPTTGSPHTGR